jgi:hypothetical protein
MYLLLHRALRNAGDYLIHERARRLIETFRPDAELVTAEAWRPLRDQLEPDILARCRAVIVSGGPGYQNGMAERYPLLSPGEGPPLVLLALGSFIVPGTRRQIASCMFDPPTRGFLDAVAARSPYLGARDRVSASILEANGYPNVLMTGDPAWYDLSAIEAPVRVPPSLRSIAVTPPANPGYFGQAIRLFERLATAFPGASVSVVHHRGVQRPFASVAQRHGWSSVDITGSSAGFTVYDDADVHVGYRVHAHLYALSRAIPTYLVAEDSRGIGVHRTLGELGAVGFDERADALVPRLVLAQLPRVANAHRAATSWIGPYAGRFLPVTRLDRLVDRVAADLEAGFLEHGRARTLIRETLPVMRQMLESLP